MQSLTRKQKLVLDFIQEYTLNNGISPTIGEIKYGLGLHAVSTIHEHLQSLKLKGYIEVCDNEARGITVTHNSLGLVKVPIVGVIAAGVPIEVLENENGHVMVAKHHIKTGEDYYALRVSGNSMIDDGIFDGDVVIIKKQSVAENGQTVVAIIDEDKATLKHLYKEANCFRLEPRNPHLQPLFRTEVEVRGVVIDIVPNIVRRPSFLSSRTTNFKTVDLFAGVGGIRIGFERAGFQTVFSNDFETQCKHTYDLNFQNAKLIVEDVRKIGVDDLPEFDFLLGGFPCQAFSIAGYRQGFSDQKGRGNLFFDIARILDARRPTGFLLENVKNLRTHDGGNTFKIITETLEGLGYHVKTKVLNTMHYGNVPQNRERIYIVGFRDGEVAERFEFPNPVTLNVQVVDLLESEVSEKYYYNGKPLYDRLKNDVVEEGAVYQWRRQYVRKNKSGVCPTLTANMGMGGHNVPIIRDKKGIRKLTPRECFNLQGFPREYKIPNIADSALYKQAGNSVSVPVVEAVARQMMIAMGY